MTYLFGILLASFNTVKAEIINIVHVAPYPGFVPDTLTIICLSIGLVCLSVGSVSLSFQPLAFNVNEKYVFSMASGLGPSWLTKPHEKNLGYCINRCKIEI